MSSKESLDKEFWKGAPSPEECRQRLGLSERASGGATGMSLTHDELASWLVRRGLADDQRGYGHASGEEVAEALLENFNITHKHDFVEYHHEGPPA